MGIAQAGTLLDAESPVGESHRILVIDDSKACALTTMWALEAFGHTVQMALNGATAIELAKSFQPDLVILDIGMPEMNGYEVCQAMCKEPVLQNTTFIALTGWGNKEHRERSKEAGFDYHLVKPVEMAVLELIILGLDKERP